MVYGKSGKPSKKGRVVKNQRARSLRARRAVENKSEEGHRDPVGQADIPKPSSFQLTKLYTHAHATTNANL
jgi:hypothetical protein